jgi:hypothetical protein
MRRGHIARHGASPGCIHSFTQFFNHRISFPVPSEAILQPGVFFLNQRAVELHLDLLINEMDGA